MKTNNTDILKEWKSTANVVTRNSLENILLNRCNRGDLEAGRILVNILKGWA